MELNYFFDTAPMNGVLPVETVVYLGSQPGFNPPRIALYNTDFGNSLNTIPVVAIGVAPALDPPR